MTLYILQLLDATDKTKKKKKSGKEVSLSKTKEMVSSNIMSFAIKKAKYLKVYL